MNYILIILYIALFVQIFFVTNFVQYWLFSISYKDFENRIAGTGFKSVKKNSPDPQPCPEAVRCLCKFSYSYSFNKTSAFFWLNQYKTDENIQQLAIACITKYNYQIVVTKLSFLLSYQIVVTNLSFLLSYQIVVTKVSVTKLLVTKLSLLFSYQIVVTKLSVTKLSVTKLSVTKLALPKIRPTGKMLLSYIWREGGGRREVKNWLA